MTTHEGNQSDPGLPVRQRQPTEKGVNWNFELKQKEWKDCRTHWRRLANKLRTLLTDDDTESKALKEQRDALQAMMDKAISAQAEFASAAQMLSIKEDSEEMLEVLEEEHSLLTKEVFGAVRSEGSLKLFTIGSTSKSRCQEWLDKQQPKMDGIPNERVCQGDRVEGKANTNEQGPRLEGDLRSTRQQRPTEHQELHQEPDRFLTTCLIEQMRLNRLPLPEPPVFDGSPLQYPAWKRAYDMLIERKGISPEDKFYYLLKYLKGQPLELVQGYSLLSNEGAYTMATKELEKRYGDSFVLSNAFRDKLDEWPRIGVKDPQGLRRYSDFLRQCHAASQFVHHLRYLDDERENRKLMAKLPEWLVTRWARTVARWRQETNSFPPFAIFAQFIEDEANIACDPVTSFHTSTQKEQKMTSTARSFSTDVQSQLQSNDEGNVNLATTCLFCNEQHFLGDCTLFASETLHTRREFVFKRGLCFGCLKRGHCSKDCHRKSTCTLCRKRHPTILHDVNWNDRSKSKDSNTNDGQYETQSSRSHASTNQQEISVGTSKTSTIVPVWLSHDSSQDDRLVYAMLDTQSDTSFLLEQTKDAMGIRGAEINLILSTMTLEDERVKSERIVGLKVRAFNGTDVINLPPTFTRSIMPANKNHIPTPDVAKAYPHLERIAGDVMPLQNCEVGLLIGYDCASALEPLSVIASPEPGAPFGLQTRLGWSIVGTGEANCEDQQNPRSVSRRAMVTILPDAVTQTDRNPTEEAHSCQSHQVVKLQEADFATVKAQRSYSQNDVKLLRPMDEQIGVSNDECQETPLTLKEAKLHNNRRTTDKRLRSSNKKFEIDSEYCGYTQINESSQRYEACVQSTDRLDRAKKRCRCTAKSRLHQLDPFVDTEGILRVDGRPARTERSFKVKHRASEFRRKKFLNLPLSREKWTCNKGKLKVCDVAIIRDYISKSSFYKIV